MKRPVVNNPGQALENGAHGGGIGEEREDASAPDRPFFRANATRSPYNTAETIPPRQYGRISS